MKQLRKLCLCLLILCCNELYVFAQDGHLIEVEIMAPSLKDNLVDDSAERSVMIYLPPGYDNNEESYPVIYLLHGFNGNVGNKSWFRSDSAVSTNTINQLIGSGAIEPMIVVMPDGSNRFGGSMYTNSVTTGNWEDYIASDLVQFIDHNYRTFPHPDGRGISGHSMGGYGAIKIAMKHPDVFSAVYGTSSCCMERESIEFDNRQELVDEILSLKSWEDVANASFWARATLASSAAFSPNPGKAPFYSDLPFQQIQDSIHRYEPAIAQRLANTPSWMAGQFRTNLQNLRAIAFDAGTREVTIQNQNAVFSEHLKINDVAHSFEIFEGGHNDKKKERFETKILPFFSKHLKH